MKRVIHVQAPDEYSDTISFDDVPEKSFIFGKKGGKITGVLMRETEGWIMRITPTGLGSTGFHSTRQKCLISCRPYFSEFVVE